MKIAITGTNDGLGHALTRYFEINNRVLRISRPEYDLDDLHSLDSIDLTGIDVLINNAGHSHGGGKNLIGHDRSQWHSIVTTNLIAPIYLTQKFLQQNSSGKIIYITSRSVEHALGGDSVYSASKSGLSTFIDCLRCEVGNQYQLIEIRPGRIKTSFVKNRGIYADQEVDDFYTTRTHLEVSDLVKIVETSILTPGLEKITVSKNQ